MFIFIHYSFIHKSNFRQQDLLPGLTSLQDVDFCLFAFGMATAKTAKTTKTSAFILVAVLVHNWTFAQLKVDQVEWTQWTRSLLPKKEDREVKEELLKRLHLATEKGEDEEILTS